MRRSTPVMLGLLLLACPLSAQEPAVDSTQPNLVLDATFHSSSYEPIRLFLASGRKYMAQFSEPNIVMQMRSYEGKQLPMIVTVNLGPDASGRTNFEIRPRVDGEFEFRPVYVYEGSPIRFQLWLLPVDYHGPQVDLLAGAAKIELGIEVSAGQHGAYENSDENYGDAGTSLATCLTMRNIGGLAGRLWGCALGVEIEGGAPDSSLVYVFMEPRVRIFGGGAKFGIEGGFLLRLATGEAKFGRASGKYGVGIYLGAQQHRPNGGGFSVLGSLSTQRVNSSDPNRSGGGTWHGNFGLGYFF